MSDLLKINVNEHCEKKNGLTYLSWAWAWAEVLKIDPDATWEPVEYVVQGQPVPYMVVGDGTAMVKVNVTVKGKTKGCVLPVMNHKNQAIQNPNAFQINTAIMRCMTKAISMHGLGLYIYAGEDSPEGEEPEPEPQRDKVIPATFRSSATMGALDELAPGEREYVEGLVDRVNELGRGNRWIECVDFIEGEELIDTHKMALWSLLDSKTRAAIKKTQQQMREKKAA